MEYRCIYLLLNAFFPLTYVHAVDDIIFQFEDGAPVQGDVVNVIEGTSVKLRCVSNDKGVQMTPTWLSAENPSFLVISELLKFDSFQIAYQGIYLCTFQDSHRILLERSLKIQSLYPPERPVICGPRDVTRNVDFTLTCDTSAFPLATIWWTLDWQDNSTVIGRGRTLNYVVQESTYEKRLYCWAENTMRPTIGEPVVTKLISQKNIWVQKTANIWELWDQYNFYVGHTVDITCRVSGVPEPEVYWTKNSDSSFSYYGKRLFQINVQKSFAGYYACHARNELFNGVKASDTKNTLVVIEDLLIPSSCQVFCLPDNETACVSSTTMSSTQTPTTMETTRTPSKLNCDSSCNPTFIALAVIGWLVALATLVIGLFCWIKCRDRPQTEKGRRRISDMSELDTGQRHVRRELPDLPYNILERDRSDEDHTYKELDASNSTEVKRDKADSDHFDDKSAEKTIPTEDVDHKYLTLEADTMGNTDSPTSLHFKDYLTPVGKEER